MECFGSDLSVAVSGIAGPAGGTVDKPVGTVWFAWARRAEGGVVELKSAAELFRGDRDAVRRFAVQRALERLLEL
jgi:nicotinamide-nucleotide amidase